MDWASFLYNLFIFPIEIIYQVIFRLSEKYISNPVISILALSVIVNILVLPLYNRADILAKKQSDAEKLISDRKKLISKTFKGDERLMMLKAYYREMHYNPYASLLGSVPLLLQIPFFIAAYHFLSNLQYLRGVSFGPISDLASPDGLLRGVNLLPILMTLINIISLLFYRRSHPEGKLLQPLVLAGLFLILLYTSPSGLVYYWTLNNLFSLLKNIVYLLLPRLKSSSKKHSAPVEKPVNMKGVHAVFIFSALFFALNTGMRYTSNLLKGCYQDFVNLVYYTDPVMLIWNGFVIACGFFIVWCSVYYLLFSDRNRRRMSFIMFALCAASLSSGIMPSQFLGQMSSVFNIKSLLYTSAADYIISTLIALIFAGIAVFLFIRFRTVAKYTALIITSAIAIFCFINMYSIYSNNSDKYYLDDPRYCAPAELPFSRNGKNVVVIMMDRSVGSMIPYVMNDDPSIAKQFDGFTFYTDANSYGCLTVVGSPSLYGGYEYTPYEMNRRSDLPISDKLNEALRVMPYLFDENGYDVTVCDPSYAGYRQIPVLDIFSDHPDIDLYVTNGAFCRESETYKRDYDEVYKRWDRNFFCYGVMCSAPDILKDFLYDNADYNSIEYAGGSIVSADAIDFRAAYYTLTHMKDMTVINESGNNFNLFVNYTTHEHVNLGTHEIGDVISDGNGNIMTLDNYALIAHYDVNKVTYEELGKWFDYLREQGVYDNTRIIIVSDHGADLGRVISKDTVDMDHLHPVLFVKDFDSTGPLVYDDSSISNAMTPYIAFEGLIDDPVNPFTGNSMDPSLYDRNTNIVIGYGSDWNTYDYDGTRYDNGTWFKVTGDFFDEDNWEQIEIP